MADNPAAVQSVGGRVPGKKYFTLGEARRALPLVKRIAADIQATQAERLRIHERLSAGMAEMPRGAQESLQREFEAASDHLEALVAELAQVGVELKDPARGLLDFPAVYEGREILLCWKGDEETIGYWHEAEAGFAGRKPVGLLGGQT
jgi:hypothetical protein